MKLPEVVTPPSIYHGFSTRKTLWEKKFTGKEHLFLAVNMKNWVRQHFRKHKEIKGSDKYVALYISSKYDRLEKMRIKYSESKENLKDQERG